MLCCAVVWCAVLCCAVGCGLWTVCCGLWCGVQSSGASATAGGGGTAWDSEDVRREAARAAACVSLLNATAGSYLLQPKAVPSAVAKLLLAAVQSASASASAPSNANAKAGASDSKSAAASASASASALVTADTAYYACALLTLCAAPATHQSVAGGGGAEACDAMLRVVFAVAADCASPYHVQAISAVCAVLRRCCAVLLWVVCCGVLCCVVWRCALCALHHCPTSHLCFSSVLMPPFASSPPPSPPLPFHLSADQRLRPSRHTRLRPLIPHSPHRRTRL